MSHVQEVTGDIANNLRLTHPIGALWLAVRDADDVFDDIYETWVHDSQVPHFCHTLPRWQCSVTTCQALRPCIVWRILQPHVKLLSTLVPGCHLSLFDAL